MWRKCTSRTIPNIPQRFGEKGREQTIARLLQVSTQKKFNSQSNRFDDQNTWSPAYKKEKKTRTLAVSACTNQKAMTPEWRLSGISRLEGTESASANCIWCLFLQCLFQDHLLFSEGHSCFRVKYTDHCWCKCLCFSLFQETLFNVISKALQQNCFRAHKISRKLREEISSSFITTME